MAITCDCCGTKEDVFHDVRVIVSTKDRLLNSGSTTVARCCDKAVENPVDLCECCCNKLKTVMIKFVETAAKSNPSPEEVAAYKNDPAF